MPKRSAPNRVKSSSGSFNLAGAGTWGAVTRPTGRMTTLGYRKKQPGGNSSTAERRATAAR